jgi:hypothetical protein
MKRGFVRYFALAVGALLVCLLGFLGGWKLHAVVRTASPAELRSFSALEKGDAPAPVRAEVQQALRRFQDGYVRRDPAQLEVFMRGLFSEKDQVVVLGTNSAEWVGGYTSVSSFVRSDWLNWGDFRLQVEDAIISSRGDVAWIATVGQVDLEGTLQPIRFVAVLTRHKAGWLFRQIEFQRVEQDSSLSELLGLRAALGHFKKKALTKVATVPDSQ